MSLIWDLFFFYCWMFTVDMPMSWFLFYFRVENNEMEFGLFIKALVQDTTSICLITRIPGSGKPFLQTTRISSTRFYTLQQTWFQKHKYWIHFTESSTSQVHHTSHLFPMFLHGNSTIRLLTPCHAMSWKTALLMTLLFPPGYAPDWSHGPIPWQVTLELNALNTWWKQSIGVQRWFKTSSYFLTLSVPNPSSYSYSHTAGNLMPLFMPVQPWSHNKFEFMTDCFPPKEMWWPMINFLSYYALSYCLALSHSWVGLQRSFFTLASHRTLWVIEGQLGQLHEKLSSAWPPVLSSSHWPSGKGLSRGGVFCMPFFLNSLGDWVQFLPWFQKSLHYFCHPGATLS